MAFNGTGSNVTSLNASNVTSGTLAVARGGTGTASPSLVGGTNITISGTWPNQTVTAAGGGVTSLNGQTGAITDTAFGAIGSYAYAVYGITSPYPSSTTPFYWGSISNYAAGSTTAAGSDLRYGLPATYGQASSSFPLTFTGFANSSYETSRTVSGRNAVGYASGGTALSGSWRAMNSFSIYSFGSPGKNPGTTGYWYPTIWVRYA